MASDNFAGDPAAMEAAARDFGAALGDLDGFVRPVREGAQALPWQGQAADRYQELLHEWLGQFAGICQALETMQTALVGTASNYGESEQWALQAVGAVGGGSASGPSPLQQSLGMR
jgi:WXG100 family type VII secretion target